MHTAQVCATGIQPSAELVTVYAEESAGVVTPFLKCVLQGSAPLQLISTAHDIFRQQRV